MIGGSGGSGGIGGSAGGGQRGGGGAAAACGVWFVVEFFCKKKEARHWHSGTAGAEGARMGARRTLAGNGRVAARSPDEQRASSSTVAGRVAGE